MKSLIWGTVVAVFCCLHPAVSALTVQNSAFQVETYISYDSAAIGRPMDFTFDSNGNMYVVHSFSDTAPNGSIHKIDTAKNVTLFASGFVDPRSITWGGGTAFGDNFYVTDRFQKTTYSDGEVTKVDKSGNHSPFFGVGLDQPDALEIDRTGNYQNKLYTASTDSDRILSTDSSGDTFSVFSPFPFGGSGSIQNIAFDTTGNYAGNMFVGARMTNSMYAGLFRIDTNGVNWRYTNFEQAACVAFDDTAQQFFDGKMFAAGRDDDAYLWTLYQVNGAFDTEIFASLDYTPGWARPAIEFGSDGAMYVMEWDNVNNDVIISRVTPVPEPATLLLLGLGGLLIRRRTIQD